MAATHARQKIRQAIIDLLSVAPDNWKRVFESREPTARAVLPYLLVYTPVEPANPLTLHQSFLMQRDLTVIVQAHLRISNVEDIEQQFDKVALEIEQKLSLSKVAPALPSLTKFHLLNTETDIVINEAGERQYGELTTTWIAQYLSPEGSPI